MSNYKEIKKKLGLTDERVGEMFGYKNIMSFKNSSGKKDIEAGLVRFYEMVILKGKD